MLPAAPTLGAGDYSEVIWEDGKTSPEVTCCGEGQSTCCGEDTQRAFGTEGWKPHPFGRLRKSENVPGWGDGVEDRWGLWHGPRGRKARILE